MERMVMDPETQVNGIVMIEDMSGFSLKKMISISREDKAQMNAGFELLQVFLPIKILTTLQQQQQKKKKRKKKKKKKKKKLNIHEFELKIQDA
jgi:hypothetical protein